MVHSNDSELIKESDGDSWDITVKIDVGETVADLNKHTNARLVNISKIQRRSNSRETLGSILKTNFYK